MPRYRLIVRETWNVVYLIDADSEQDARSGMLHGIDARMRRGYIVDDEREITDPVILKVQEVLVEA
jgi:hypothetical protein